ncbi:hypothetical protein Tco_1538833 [Tanacetum coccineum]
MSSIYDLKSTLTQTALDAFCYKYHVLDYVHHELPGPNQSIRNSPGGKIGAYTRFFDFANFQIPLSRFLVDVIEYFRINLSQLSIIDAAKPLDSLKTGIAASFGLMPLFCLLPSLGTLKRHWFPKPFLCLVGLSRYCELDDNVYPTFLTDTIEEIGLFVFIRHAYPTKGDQNDNVEGAGPHDLNEEGGDAEATAADKPEGKKKRRRAVGASGFEYPPKKFYLHQHLSHLNLVVTAATLSHLLLPSDPVLRERDVGGSTDSIIWAKPSHFSTVLEPLVLLRSMGQHRRRFNQAVTDSASPSVDGPDVAGPSHPAGAEVSTNTFYVSQDMDSKTLHMIDELAPWFPKLNHDLSACKSGSFDEFKVLKLPLLKSERGWGLDVRCLRWEGHILRTLSDQVTGYEILSKNSVMQSRLLKSSTNERVSNKKHKV